MRRALKSALILGFLLVQVAFTQQQPLAGPQLSGFRNATEELLLEQRFLKVPQPYLAEQHLKLLTAVPHMAGTPEDRKTADYVAQKFREAGLETRIDEYKVWMNYPVEVRISITAPPGVHLHAPSREHVAKDPYQDDPRIVVPFSGSSPSGDVEREVVYANYGRPEDFDKLKQMGIDVRGKIVLVRYGENFRGVKSFLAERAGAAGVIIYSDPIDDGYFRGDVYPKGPFRPETGVQRGSVEYMFEYPGDVTTPGVASVPSLPLSKRVPPDKAVGMPKIPTTPISYGDARPILENLGGPETPRDWQGGLPFTYHVGPGPVRVHMLLKMDYQYRTIWNVLGTVPGSELPDEWVMCGNHRDAWVFGAVDPNSGTAAMLETVHGIGSLLKSGWKPRRTLIFASWDAEEEGLVGSTDYVEQYATDLDKAVAYFNMDAAVSGPNFGASAVPSLKQFLRDVTKAVPSPKGGTVYDSWKSQADAARRIAAQNPDVQSPARRRMPAADSTADVPVGDLGSGSDYTGFLQHLGVPSTDIATGGPYGVYHSAFDDFAWFKKFGDPTFVYEQEMARVMGLQVLRMCQSDVLPFDYGQYGKEISNFLATAQKRAETAGLAREADFASALSAAQKLEAAGNALQKFQQAIPQNPSVLNAVLIKAERELLTDGLPHRPFFRHAIFAPGEFTGYAAVVIPGVNEAIDQKDVPRLRDQLKQLTEAVQRTAALLDSIR